MTEANNTQENDKKEHSVLRDIFLHAAILIPIEFGLLHATPLGPMITSFFQDAFATAGFEFASQAAHAAGDMLVI